MSARPESLVVVIPVFNEAATVARVVEGALAHAPVLVVDDGSTDTSGARAAAAGAEVIRHPRRLGKGQAILSGMAAAAIRGATAVVTLDGDGQHDPADIPRLKAAADACPDALVIGSRLRQARELERGRLNALQVTGFFMNWATGLRLDDTQSGFRLYPLALVRGLPTGRGGFVFETEVMLAAARRGIAMCEVPVRTRPRSTERSRFRPVVDGCLIGALLARHGMARWRVELGQGLAVVAAVVGHEQRTTRHTAMLLEASVYRDSPGLWAAAIGAGAGRRAADRLATWWRHPRRRRASAAAAGIGLLPLLAGLALCQTLLDRLGRDAPDLVTPLVRRWFSQERLVALDPVAEAASPGVVPSSLDAAPVPGAGALSSPPALPS
jgi:hypothetical protein